MKETVLSLLEIFYRLQCTQVRNTICQDLWTSWREWFWYDWGNRKYDDSNLSLLKISHCNEGIVDA